jgi:hypothetical protein
MHWGGKKSEMICLTGALRESLTRRFSTILSRALRTAAMLGLSGIALSTLAVSAKANLIINGNFQSFTGGFGGAASQINDTGTGGYTQLTGWTAGPGSSGLLGFLIPSGAADTTGVHDVRFNDTFQLWGPGAGGGSVANGLTATSPDGGNYVAMDAAPSLRGSGISQTLAGLTPGTSYLVSFYWAAAQQHGFDGATTESVQVTFGGQTQTTPTFNNASHGFSGWMTNVFNFTANSANPVLTFLSVGGPDGLPPFVLLDGVSVNAAVPEPGSLTLVLGGLFGGLGFLRWKKRLKRSLRAGQDQSPLDI